MADKVSLQLARLLYDYIKNRRDINETFIEKVVDIVVTNLDLNDYVRRIIIDNNPWDGKTKIEPADYGWKQRTLTIRLQTMLEFYKADSKNLKLNDYERFAIIYDRIMQVILHELEHANQNKKRNIKDSNLENKLIAVSTKGLDLILQEDLFDKLISEGYPERKIYSYLKEKQEIYSKYWLYAPIERLAEYHSHTTMAAIFKELTKYPGISYYECLKLCYNYLKGYANMLSPTAFYLSKIGDIDSYFELEEKGSNLDFESRASMGLSITDSEYDYLYATTRQLEKVVIR